MDTRRTLLALRPVALAATAFCASAISTADAQQPASRSLPQGSGFDFYVLALSWSPSYCAAEGEDANRMQCGADSDHGFIVHGLWPQFESGYPEFCATEWPERVEQNLGETLFDIMPGMGLIGHQWRKHGSCTGLSPEDYFAVLRAAHERISLPGNAARADVERSVDPDRVEADFVAANAGLEPDGMAVTCDGEHLREVRICLTKDLDFRPCPEVDADSCSRSTVTMPAAP